MSRLENQKQCFLPASHLVSFILRNIISTGVVQSWDVIMRMTKLLYFQLLLKKKKDITFTFQNIFKQGLFVKALDILKVST